MRILWTLVKIVVGLAIVLPLCVIALAVGLGIFAALLGLALFALKIAFFALIAYGLFRLVAHLFRPAPTPRVRELPPVDPHYEAAMRELDRELGHHSPRR